MLKIALVQLDTTGRDEVLKKVEGYLREYRADIFVFPELLTTGYKEPHLKADRGETLKVLKEFSKDYDTALVFSMAFKWGDNVYNRAFFLYGGREFYYDKAHLFKPLGEAEYFKPGKSLKVFRIDFKGLEIVFSLQICYDLRFPEAFRTLALEGVKAVFIPAQWPLVRVSVWKSMLVSRAAENGIFIIGCNRVGEEKGVVYGGSSSIVSPSGEVLLELGKREGIGVVEIDLNEVERVRKKINVLGDMVDLEVDKP